MKLSCQKDQFSIDENVHYLNCAYMAPLLKTSEEAGMKGMLLKRNPQSISGDSFFNELPLLRAAIAELIGTKEPSQVAIVPSASYGMANAARNVICSKGQNIIVVRDEFPSNYQCWKNLCEEKELNLIVISPDDDARDITENWNHKIIDAIDSNTAVVAIEHTHWMMGTLFDLKSISEKIKQFDAYFMVDGTQSVGMLPIDVTELGIDALVCAGYKWLLGPYSIGFAYYSERMLHGTPMEENWINRKGSHNFGSLTNYSQEYREGAIKFDVGETSNFILVPMFLAAIRQILEWGVQEMHQYITTITLPFVEELRSRKMLGESGKAFSPHLMGINLPESIDTNQLNNVFLEHNVLTSIRGSFLRVSPNMYNSADQIKLLQDILLKHL